MSEVTRFDAVITATSSIAHGAEPLGTTTYLRRERFLLPNGTVDELPIVSGNTWRGLLRRTAADLWWQAAGQPKLTVAVAHAIWSGGALAKSTGSPLTGSRLQRVRAACPVVGLFGTAGGGRIISGNTMVGKLVPICQETAHLIPAHIINQVGLGELRSVWDLTQIEEYSKHRLPDGSDVVDAEFDNDTVPARFGVETFITGTQFYSWVAVNWPLAPEYDLFTETLHTFDTFARVGGLAASGHGNITIAYTPELPTTPNPGAWRDSVTNEPELLKVLAWLD